MWQGNLHQNKTELFRTCQAGLVSCHNFIHFLSSVCEHLKYCDYCKSLSDASLPKWLQNSLTFWEYKIKIYQNNQTNISKYLKHHCIGSLCSIDTLPMPCRNAHLSGPRSVSTCAAPSQSAHCPACYCQAALFAPEQSSAFVSPRCG